MAARDLQAAVQPHRRQSALRMNVGRCGIRATPIFISCGACRRSTSQREIPDQALARRLYETLDCYLHNRQHVVSRRLRTKLETGPTPLQRPQWSEVVAGSESQHAQRATTSAHLQTATRPTSSPGAPGERPCAAPTALGPPR